LSHFDLIEAQHKAAQSATNAANESQHKLASVFVSGAQFVLEKDKYK